MKNLIIEKGTYPEIKKVENSAISKKGWSIKQENGKFVLNYISGELAGKLKSIEITKEDFELAEADKLSLDQLSVKYNFS